MRKMREEGRGLPGGLGMKCGRPVEGGGGSWSNRLGEGNLLNHFADKDWPKRPSSGTQNKRRYSCCRCASLWLSFRVHRPLLLPISLKLAAQTAKH